VIDHNTLEYIPNSSSLDTLKYIQEVCEKTVWNQHLSR